MNSIFKGLVSALGGDVVIQLLISVLASKGVDGATRAATVDKVDATKIAATFGIHDDAGISLIVQDFRDLGTQVGTTVGHLLK